MFEKSFLVSISGFEPYSMTPGRPMAYDNLVASKCGFEVFGPERKVTNSAKHIKEYIEGTIDRLGFTPDLYYLHRIDPSEYNPLQLEILSFPKFPKLRLLTRPKTPRWRSLSELWMSFGVPEKPSISAYLNALPQHCARQTQVRLVHSMVYAS